MSNRAIRQAQAVYLRKRGKTHAEIAKQLGIGRSAVSRLLGRLEAKTGIKLR